MSDKISRRELAKASLLGAAVLVLPTTGTAQETTKPPTTDIDPVAMVEKKLAKPLSERAKELLKTSLNDSRQAAEARLATKLPENSEPCFVYFATPARESR
jgi:hypothetical protein